MGVATLAVAALAVSASLVSKGVVAQPTAQIYEQLQANGVNVTALNQTVKTSHGPLATNGCSFVVSTVINQFLLSYFWVYMMMLQGGPFSSQNGPQVATWDWRPLPWRKFQIVSVVRQPHPSHVA